MITFKQMMKYTPPDISVFKKYGHGYLNEAKDAVDFARSAFFDSRPEVRKNPTWGVEPLGLPLDNDLVVMYAYWTMADDLLKRLERMEPAEREKQLALDTNPKYGRTLEETSQKHAELTGMIVAWEEEGKERIYPALDRQLKRRMDTWEKYLGYAEKSDFEEFGADPMETVADFCDERDIIEYAAMGIDNLQFRHPGRLKPLPYLETFILRRLKLDEQFRKALKGRYQEAPWADPAQFWWHYPPKK